MRKLLKPPYQNWWWRRRGIGGAPIDGTDPSAIDPDNIVMLFDGDLDLNASDWKNQVGAQALMTLVNPIIDATGLNNHGIVSFNGSFGSGNGGEFSTLSLDFSEYSYTTYIIWRVNTYTGNRHIFDRGGGAVHKMTMTASPSYVMGTGGISLPLVVAGSWTITSATMVAGSGNSTVRTWRETDGIDTGRNAGTFGLTADTSGIWISKANPSWGEGACSFAYILWRQGEDSLETQDAIFTALRTRFDWLT